MNGMTWLYHRIRCLFGRHDYGREVDEMIVKREPLQYSFEHKCRYCSHVLKIDVKVRTETDAGYANFIITP